MKVRGERECKDCGARWSYYDTGSVECPACGSLRSVGVDDERRLHTDAPVGLDLTEAREAVESASLREAADRAADLARGYVRKRGFVDAGELRALDDAYLAAAELRHVAGELRRAMDVSDDEEWYFLELLRGADDPEGPRRPAPDEVPASLRALRGLAYADAVGEYRGEMVDWADDRGVETPSALERLVSHVKRVRALDGDVDPDEAELLVETARDIGRHLREGDDEALASARERLDRLG